MEAAQRNQVISAYPYPIAILYRIVTAIDIEEEPGKALGYMLETAEAVSRFLGVVALVELIRLKEKGKIEIPNAVKVEFHKNIKRPTFWIWLSFAREGLGHIKGCGEDAIIPEMTHLFYENDGTETEFKHALDKLVKIRNAIAHMGINLDTVSKQRSAASISLSFLHTVLKRLTFLEEIKFGYIKTIEVKKKPREAAVFQHKGKRLAGDNIGKGTNLTGEFSDYKETDAVIIRYDQNEYLNLHPFYVYDETCGDAADIFYFNGLDKQRLEYIGIGPGGKFYVEAREEKSNFNVDEQFDMLMGRNSGDHLRGNVKCSMEMYREYEHIIAMIG